MAKVIKLVSDSYLRERYHYNPETGDVVGPKGKPLRSKMKKGYLGTKIRGKFFLVHRLAWFLYYGSWPKQTIDHINRIKTDNRIVNLRDVSLAVNCQNKRHVANKITGRFGISFSKTAGAPSKYRTMYNGKQHCFPTLKAAVAFRKEMGLAV